MRNGKAIAIVTVFLLTVLLAGCGKTHTSIQGVTGEGWAAHNVELGTARISPLFGGVSYSKQTNQYVFAVYDKSMDKPPHIPVVVKAENIDFEPNEGDFIAIKGELQGRNDDALLRMQKGWRYNEAKGEALIIYATEIRKIDPPADW